MTLKFLLINIVHQFKGLGISVCTDVVGSIVTQDVSKVERKTDRSLFMQDKRHPMTEKMTYFDCTVQSRGELNLSLFFSSKTTLEAIPSQVSCNMVLDSLVRHIPDKRQL